MPKLAAELFQMSAWYLFVANDSSDVLLNAFHFVRRQFNAAFGAIKYPPQYFFSELPHAIPLPQFLECNWVLTGVPGCLWWWEYSMDGM